MHPNELISKVTEWARCDPRVIALGICGSYARGEARPDSDIDFCILSTSPKSLLEERSWIRAFGPDARFAGPVEDYNLVQSVRAFYGMIEVEFGVTDEAWVRAPLDAGTASVINDGFQVLYDPEGRLREAVACAARML